MFIHRHTDADARLGRHRSSRMGAQPVTNTPPSGPLPTPLSQPAPKQAQPKLSAPERIKTQDDVPGIETLTDAQADAWLSLVEIVFGEIDLSGPFPEDE